MINHFIHCDQYSLSLLGFFNLTDKLSKHSYLFIFMLIEVKPILFAFLYLRQVIVEGFLWNIYNLSSFLEWDFISAADACVELPPFQDLTLSNFTFSITCLIFLYFSLRHFWSSSSKSSSSELFSLSESESVCSIIASIYSFPVKADNLIYS